MRRLSNIDLIPVLVATATGLAVEQRTVAVAGVPVQNGEVTAVLENGDRYEVARCPLGTIRVHDDGKIYDSPRGGRVIVVFATSHDQALRYAAGVLPRR